jgi:hypothetical protein
MKITKSLAAPALAMSLLFTASAALAQEVVFTDIDGIIDGVEDGILDQAELEATGLFTPEEVTALLVLDTDGDGLTTEDIIAGEVDTEGEEPVEEGEDGGLVDDGDGNHGHGNSPNGFDTDNPGRGHGTDGRPGNSPDKGNRGGNKHQSSED